MENRYLDRLSDLYPTIAAASTEIINLQAILNLPKGTEHFLTDVHGEDEAFSHVLRNGSGAVRSKIEDVFGNTMSVKDKKALATLIYYPKAKMEQVKRTESNMDDWYRVNLYRLIEVSKRAASKYTRSKVRKSLPKDLLKYHSVDIQWGNHDVVWMGAAAGQLGCIANVIRICARYGNLDIIEDGYGINLLPLATFAMRMYKDDPCTCFKLKGTDRPESDEMQMNLRIHKAISIIQFKVEGQIIERQKGFHLENRALLHKIDYQKGTINLEGKEYKLLDTNFPTIDPKNPYKLTSEEEEIMDRLVHAFVGCEKLQEHMRFLLAKGGLYKVYNNNLLYHGCVPLDAKGNLKEVEIFGKKYRGKALYDVLESYVRKGFFALDPKEREDGKDTMWYIWLHPDSPLFGKNKMATFERYFLAEKETHIEKKNPYYALLENETVVDNIMIEFGLDPKEDTHIVNGHVPVKRKDGESPIKCNGKVMVIDGGFSRAYQKETGIAGYTLVYNSYGLLLVAHEPFESTEAAIKKENDIHSETVVVTRVNERRLVGDTDAGRKLKEQIKDLEWLLASYRNGQIIEKL
ncbi:MAG: fructose-1,6-bisphosphatase [Clostridiales bacterium]|nr:fructose-1,6-bisphosphatase [Clostridiales bacterium]